jgi:hypothetical protein
VARLLVEKATAGILFLVISGNHIGTYGKIWEHHGKKYKYNGICHEYMMMIYRTPFFDIFSVFQNDDMVYLPLVYGHLLGKNAGKTSLYFGDDHNP